METLVKTHNSESMNTVVELFVIEETAELIYDNEKLEKWNQHVEALGLIGQKKIVKPEKSPIPFMHMNVPMVAMFETLCPRKVAIEEYNVTPIPVEILDVVALSKGEKYFERIEIWYDDKTPDPVCVGINCEWYTYEYSPVPELKMKTFPSKDACIKAIQEIMPDFVFKGQTIGWEQNKTHYLLGKWADVKHSFEELKQMAAKRFMGEKGAELHKTIKYAQRELTDLQTTAFDKFGGGVDFNKPVPPPIPPASGSDSEELPF